VALIDGNLGLGDLDVLLGVEARAALGEVITGRRSLREVMIRLPWGADFAGGGLGGPPGRMLDPLRRLKLMDQVAALRGDYDLVIVDCNAGAGGEVMEFCTVADRIFVVTTPEPPAVASAYGLLKVLARKGHLPKVALVVNAAGDRSEAEEIYRRIGSVARQFLGAEIGDGGYVLEDPAVAHAVRRRRPFLQAYPRCDASRSLAALAARVLPTAERTAAPMESGLLGRILGYLD
jgi:flagellar biosynthesis protein FlhG